MTQCKQIGCLQPAQADNDFCETCHDELLGRYRRATRPTKGTSSGGDNDYWLIEVPHPKRLKAYTAETEDLIEALGMTFQEGEAFKALIRKCKLRMGEGKPGDTEIRNAEKVAHFGGRMVAMEQRKLECTT